MHGHHELFWEHIKHEYRCGISASSIEVHGHSELFWEHIKHEYRCGISASSIEVHGHSELLWEHIKHEYRCRALYPLIAKRVVAIATKVAKGHHLCMLGKTQLPTAWIWMSIANLRRNGKLMFKQYFVQSINKVAVYCYTHTKSDSLPVHIP